MSVYKPKMPNSYNYEGTSHYKQGRDDYKNNIPRITLTKEELNASHLSITHNIDKWLGWMTMHLDNVNIILRIHELASMDAEHPSTKAAIAALDKSKGLK